jgi:alpha-1,2-mannosyltransferase
MSQGSGPFCALISDYSRRRPPARREATHDVRRTCMSGAHTDHAIGILPREDVSPPIDLLSKLCSPSAAHAIMALALVAIFPWSVHRAVKDGGCDLQDFCISGQYVLDHGVRMYEILDEDGNIARAASCLGRYLPSVDIAFIPLALLPISITAALWYCMNVASWYGLLRIVQRELLTIEDTSERQRGTLAAALLMLPVAVDGFLLGSFHMLVVLLTVAGLTNAWHGRAVRGGLLLGIGVWLKLLPIVGVGYLLLKRKWLAAGVAVLCVLTIDVALSVVGYGPATAWQEHVHWLNQGAVGSATRQMDERKANDEDRITNQSTMVVVRRLFNDRAGFPKLTITTLSPAMLGAAELSVLGGLGAAVLWLLRRPASALRPDDWSAEISLVLLSTLWFSPVVWSYHFSAAFPALAFLMARPGHEASKRATAGVWIFALACFTIPLARAGGHMLWATFFVGAQVAVVGWKAPKLFNPAATDRPGSDFQLASHPKTA